MRKSLLCLLFATFAGIASAQSTAGLSAGDNSAQMNQRLREADTRNEMAGSDELRRQAAQKADIELQQRLFYDRAKHFVELWKKMTKQMSEQNVVDVKLARKLSDAFHDLEKSEAWPVREPK